MNKYLILGMMFFASCSIHDSNQNLLISGPMLGFSEHRSVAIWLEVSPNTHNVAVNYRPKHKNQKFQKKYYQEKLHQSINPVKIIIPDLEMNTEYEYEIYLNGENIHFDYPLSFKTKELWEWRTNPPDFSFMIGSCNYVNDSIYDRPGISYGQSPKIFETMVNESTDFMIWLGDNAYLREADYSSPSGIEYRFSHTRKLKELQQFLASRPHYAIWDDHDFGPNDSNSSYELKNEILEIFKKYWANKTFGENGQNGIYSKFNYNDAEFFLLDNRFFRSNNKIPNSVNGFFNTEKQYLGLEQLNWLQNGLLSSQATFKFIVCGNQITNAYTGIFESYRNFAYEYNELVTFIISNKIEGIVFLSGDRHYSEMLKTDNQLGYPFYEYTSSPLSATPFVNFKNFDEYHHNPTRVENSLFIDQNFGKISIYGEPGNRKVKFQTIDINGKVVFEYEIGENLLKFKTETP